MADIRERLKGLAEYRFRTKDECNDQASPFHQPAPTPDKPKP